MMACEFRHARHRYTVKRCRISVIAALKDFSLVTEMLPDEPHLVRVLRVLDHDTLNSARVRHPEDMRCLTEIEGHDGLPHLMNILLLGLT